MSLRLLLVTGTFPQLSETFIYRKAITLARRGHSVTVLCRAEGDRTHFPGPLPASMRVERLLPDGGWRNPKRAVAAVAGTVAAALRASGAVRDLLALCQSDARTRHDPVRHFIRHLPFLDRRASAIHFEFLGTGAMYPLVREVSKLPVLVSCRGSDIHMLDFQPDGVRRAMRDFLRQADAIHCVSDEIARTVRRQIGERERIVVNRAAVAVDTIAERPASAAECLGSAADGPLQIMATGRLTWKKGFDYLVAALAQVAKQGIAFHATICGDGELLAPLRFSVRDLGLAGKVSFIGAVSPDDVLARLQRTDVFVLPSLDEGISNAVLEAMASGVPVITTNVGGMTEAVRDQQDGLVIPPRDVDAMANAIRRLARRRDERYALGHSARERAVTEFSLERQARVFEGMYRELCE